MFSKGKSTDNIIQNYKLVLAPNNVRSILLVGFFCAILIQSASAQFATIGGGVLVTERPLESVAEINVQTPPFYKSRVYVTLSWTDISAKPTIITAVERSIFGAKNLFETSAGMGMLMIEPNNYEPDFMLLSSTSVPLPVPRTALVLIGSVTPFENFNWSLVLKVGWAIWFLE